LLSSDPLIDVLIVTRNNYEQFVPCVESLLASTVVPFKLHVYLNEFQPEVDSRCEEYLLTLFHQYRGAVNIQRSRTNDGFIAPNNLLAEKCNASFLFLLNDDTYSHPGWDIALLHAFYTQKDVGIVGFSGGIIGEDAIGCGITDNAGDSPLSWTDLVDYVEGWSLLVSRECLGRLSWNTLMSRTDLYRPFNPRLRFAYGEDSCLCLDAKEAGFGVLAVRNRDAHGEPFIQHFGGQTSGKVMQEADDSPAKIALRENFARNHALLREWFADYLKNDRVLVRLERGRLQELYAAV
jgi:GT2 family glycosyltransferase